MWKLIMPTKKQGPRWLSQVEQDELVVLQYLRSKSEADDWEGASISKIYGDLQAQGLDISRDRVVAAITMGVIDESVRVRGTAESPRFFPADESVASRGL